MAMMSGFRRFFRRPTPEVRQDVDAELESHLEMKARELIDHGLEPEEARMEARRRFGNLASIRRQCIATQSRIARIAARTDWIGALLSDLRYAVRTLRKSPGFTAVVVLSLALGIGATSTIFSALNPILLRPLPFSDPDRLVHISEDSAERPNARRIPMLSTYVEWKEHSPALEQIEWVVPNTQVNTTPGIDGAERTAIQWVSPGLFSMLGVQPILGRNFVPEDAFPWEWVSTEARPSGGVIFSYGFWQRRFGGDPDIIGQTWAQNWANHVVVGVMPPGFQVFSWNETDLWEPFDNAYGGRWMQPIGRLNPGVNVELARTQLDGIARRLDQSGVSSESGWRVRVDPLHEFASGRYTSNLYLLMGAAVLVLLIACTNVASLLVGRATNRHRELTTRAALGAGRLRLVRQLLTESVVLALLGGALGVLLALVGTGLFVSLAPTWYLPAEEIRVDGTVLGFTLGLSLLTAILFGMAPAVRASNPDLARSLKEAGRGSPGGPRPLVQNLLVGSQIALTLVLLAGAALMANSFIRLAAVDRGFNPEHLLTARIDLGSSYNTRYRSVRNGSGILTISPEADIFYREVLERLRALPGVEAAEMTRPESAFTIRLGRAFRLLSAPALPPGEQLPRAPYYEVSSGFFSAMEIPLLRGRAFTQRDTEGSPWVAVINETMARQFFPDEDPIGKLLQAVRVGSGNLSLPPATIRKPREIVGVVGDVRLANSRYVPGPKIYVPYTQHPVEYVGGNRVHLSMQLLLKTTAEPLSLAADVRSIVVDLDPEVAVYDIQSMEALLEGTFNAERFWMRALGIFATLALVLAVVGIYGVVSYAVGQRTHEIGVRMALGAQRTDVLGMVLRQGLVMSVGGVIVGVLGAVAATRLISSWLYGVEATDPATFAIVSLVLVGIALLASYVPARRATRVDPLIALRSE